MLELAHLADGTGPGLQRFRPISSQLLNLFPSEEELKGEAKPAEDEAAHEGQPCPCPRARVGTARAGCPALLSVCPTLSGHGWGVPLSGARAGDCLVGSVDPQGDEIPAVNVAQGFSAFLSVEEEQGSLQGAPRALEVCRNRGSVALGWAHPGCPPTLPTLTLFALPGPWEL